MSGVLTPIGPQPARVYWLRRLVVLGLPLLLIIVIAVSCSGGGKKPSAGNGGSGTSPTTSSTSTSTSTPECAPGDLSAQISTSAQIYAPGDSPVFTGILTNVSSSACNLTTSPSDEIWTVTTGADKYWTTGPSAGCPTNDVATTKLLEPGASRTVSITWDGKRLLPGCTPDSTPAAPGTYHLHAKLDGVPAQQVVFAIHTA